MFAGVNMFLARLRLRLKGVLRRAKNIFTPKNINSITIIIISEGIHKKESKTVQYKAIAIFSVNALGIAWAFILLYKSFRCHWNVKLWQNTVNVVKRIFASKFSKGR